jgi:hypothetical protein
MRKKLQTGQVFETPSAVFIRMDYGGQLTVKRYYRQ